MSTVALLTPTSNAGWVKTDDSMMTLTDANRNEELLRAALKAIDDAVAAHAFA